MACTSRAVINTFTIYIKTKDAASILHQFINQVKMVASGNPVVLKAYKKVKRYNAGYMVPLRLKTRKGETKDKGSQWHGGGSAK